MVIRLTAMLSILAGLLLPAGPARAQRGSDSVVSATARWDHAQAHPGDRRVLAVVLDVAERFHVNADRDRLPEGASFLIPTEVAVVGEGGGPPLGLSVGRAQFPGLHGIPGKLFGVAGDLPVFEGRVVIYLPVTVAGDALPGRLELTAVLTVQACDDRACLVPSTIALPVPLDLVAVGEPLGERADADGLFDGFAAATGAVEVRPAPGTGNGAEGVGNGAEASAVGPGGSWLAWAVVLVLAFAGGTMLNVMPCVLPVIPIKILGLVQSAPGTGRRARLGMAMAAGVLGFWVAMGAAIAGLADVQGVAKLIATWWFNIGLGVLIGVLAVGMCGLFAIRLPRFVYAISPGHDSYSGALGFGLMTAVLATPCTGPFMGGAAGTVLTAGPVAAVSVFSAIGLGMAWPYLLLTLMPGLIERVPRTGPASELVKQVLGLGMLAAGAFFIGTGINSMLSDGTQSVYQWYWWLCGAVVAGTGLWLAIRTVQITRDLRRRLVFGLVGLAMLGAGPGLAWAATRPSEIAWQYYTPQRFEAALAEGQVVVLDFTADWCINCKVLERTVLETRPVIDATHQDRVVAMKVDLTGSNPEGWAKLNAIGKVAIPVLAVIAPDGEVVMNEEVYTAGQVVEAIDAALMR